MPKTVAVIDVGSNSIKLLVAESTPSGLHTCFSETIETRISTGISQERPSLSAAAIEAGTATIVELLGMADHYKPAAIRIVATSAVRDAANGDAFIQTIEAQTGHRLRILSGEEEATYIGRGLSCDPSLEGIPDFIQVDIGGGSLELIRFAAGSIEQAISLQLGAVRLSERYISDREAPLDETTEQGIRDAVEASLRQSQFTFSPTDLPFIATGGAFTVSRAVLAANQGESIENISPRLEREALNTLKERLASLPLHERLKTAHLPATRADIIPTALITIDTLLQLAGREHVTHSFYNLRYGIAAELLKL